MIQTYDVGLVGIDMGRVSLPVIEEEIERVLSILMNRQRAGDRAVIVATDRKGVLMAGDVRLSCGFEPRSRKPYMGMEVFAKNPDGNNLRNMGMQKFLEKYDTAASVLREWYQIGIPMEHKAEGRFTELEVNMTFPTEFPFTTYARIIRLLTAAIGGEISTVEKSGKSMDEAIKAESILCNHGTYAVRIYNKSKQIEKKLKCTSLKHLMRFEFLYKKGQIIDTDFGARFFTDFTDELLQKAYQKRFFGFFNKVDKYLMAKEQLGPGVGRKDTAANIIARYCQNGVITSQACIIGELMAYEVQYGVPLILDIRDLRFAMEHLQSAGILDLRYRLEDHINSFNTAYQQMRFSQGSLNYQYELAKEIKEHFWHPVSIPAYLDQ